MSESIQVRQIPERCFMTLRTVATRLLNSVCAAAFALIALAPTPAWAQNAVGSVTTGANPNAMAVNPVTNKIYVANSRAAP